MKDYLKIILVMLIAISAFALIVCMVKALPRSSSSEPAAEVAPILAPAQLISTLDLQRELNRRNPKLKLVEDGVYGPATKAAHERAMGDQYALELWPEESP